MTIKKLVKNLYRHFKTKKKYCSTGRDEFEGRAEGVSFNKVHYSYITQKSSLLEHIWSFPSRYSRIFATGHIFPIFMNIPFIHAFIMELIRE